MTPAPMLHLTNMLVLLPMWTPLRTTSATVSSPWKSSSALATARAAVGRGKVPVYVQSSSPTHLRAKRLGEDGG